MKKFVAIFCLVSLILTMIYAFEFLVIRSRLRKEARRISKISSYYEMSEPTASKLAGRERISNMVPKAPYYKMSKPTARLLLPLPKELFLSDDSNFELRAGENSPHGFSRLVSQPVDLGNLGISKPVYLRYRMDPRLHLFFLFLTWVLTVSFLRFLKIKPSRGGKREMQLQEELAYLSKTYQSLSKSLRLERQKVEAILNSAPDGIFVCSPDGVVTFWNRSMETMTRLSSQKVVGKHYRESINIFSGSGQLLADPFSGGLAQGKNLNLLDCQIEVLQTPDSAANPILPVALGAAPVSFTEGGVNEIVVTVKDIRPQKEAEQLRKDMQAMITHDLRSPLSAMLGYAGLIRNAKICKNEEDALKYLDSLARAGKEMLILISNLLGWSWLEEGKIKFHKESLPVSPILKEVVENLEVLAKPKNLSIAVGAPEDLWVLTDGDKLKEILNNLITNAVKFSRPGGTVKISALEEGDKVRISVKDEGLGIPSEEKEKLFEKFSNLRKPGSGTGLGLYIVKTLTEALDGTVEVESEVGQGSIFTLLLPAVPKIATHSQQLSLLSLVGGADSKTGTV